MKNKKFYCTDKQIIWDGDSMEKKRKLVIVGDSEFAKMAYDYFMLDSKYEVVAFAVEHNYRKEEKLCELPVIDFEQIEKLYPPMEYDVFVAIGYRKLNRVRTRLFHSCKNKGYHCATYVSSHAFVWHNVELGENVFIFEDNTVQYHVKIGDNVILWSGNHIGHGTIIEDNCWLTSHDVISGFCQIGKNSFIGVNATLGDSVSLPEDTVFGAGALTVKNIETPGRVFIGAPAKDLGKTSYTQFGLEEDEI